MASDILKIPFAARGHDGIVSVSIALNDDPEAVGCPPWASGFPICEATIDFAAAGYDALLGWVQLVRMRSPHLDPSEQWVTDPLEIYQDLETPFGFYGLTPTLFDAPARSNRSLNLDWYAESFLCFAPTRPMAKEAKVIAAFSWGFLLDEGTITSQNPELLPHSAWNQHIELLSTTYPSWHFVTSDLP